MNFRPIELSGVDLPRDPETASELAELDRMARRIEEIRSRRANRTQRKEMLLAAEKLREGFEEFWLHFNAWTENDITVEGFSTLAPASKMPETAVYDLPGAVKANPRIRAERKFDLDRAIALAESSLASPVFIQGQFLDLVETVDIKHGLGLTGYPWLASVLREEVQRRYCRVGFKHGKNWFYNIGKKREPIYATTKEHARFYTESPHSLLRIDVARNAKHRPSAMNETSPAHLRRKI